MRLVILAAALTLAACSSSSSEQRADGPPGKAPVQQGQAQSQPPPPPGAGGMGVSPMSTGRQRVKGGETFGLRGSTLVTVQRVLYLNSPCPPGVECIHSGVIRSVEFDVARDGQHQQITVALGMPRVADGVQLQVLDVQPGPIADIEASLPVAGVQPGAGGLGH